MKNNFSIKKNSFNLIKLFGFLSLILLSNTLIAQETICNDGIDNDGDGDFDYFDLDCQCSTTAVNAIDLDFSNGVVISGDGLSLNNKIRYSDVATIGNQTIDIIATVSNFINIPNLDEHGVSSSGQDALVKLPSMDLGVGTTYDAKVKYELVQGGTNTLISGSFELEIRDIDKTGNRVESIIVPQSEVSHYFLADPTNLTTNFSSNKITITGTQDQGGTDPEAAVKLVFENVNTFNVTFRMYQFQSGSTGRAGFNLDGNDFLIFGKCLPDEICNNGIDDDNDGLTDYLDIDCNCTPSSYPNPIQINFANSSPITGTGTNLNNQVKYSNVATIGNQSIDIIATVVSFNNLSSLSSHATGSGSESENVRVSLPNESGSIGDIYNVTIEYDLVETGTTNSINASFELEINDLDKGTQRIESIIVSQNEATGYILSNPTNLLTDFSSNNIMVAGTQDQNSTDPAGAVKFIFADVNSFSITYQAELYQSTQTGISGFHLDGNEFSIFGNCLPKETCNNNQDDDGDNLVDCNDPDCQVAPPAAIIYDQQ